MENKIVKSNNFKHVRIVGIFTIMGAIIGAIIGGFIGPRYIDHLESRRSEKAMLWQIYTDIENYRMNRDYVRSLVEIKSFSLLLRDKNFGAQIYLYALLELNKMGKLSSEEEELMNNLLDKRDIKKDVIEEDLLKKIRHTLNPGLRTNRKNEAY